MKVGFLGPKGSFTYMASHLTFPQEDLIAQASITSLIKEYEEGLLDYAVVPLENSIEGSVHQTVDYLYHQGDLKTVAELVLPIRQQLMVKGQVVEIEKIYSHPQALAQSEKFIQENYPAASLEITESTALAAKYVSENPGKNIAAIAPKLSARTYGLEIVAEDIQEMEDNNTRFWILGRKDLNLDLINNEIKSSIAFTLPNNNPGALYQVLKVFADKKINLSKIESRPLKTVLGEYFFLIDFISDKTEADQVIEGIRLAGSQVKDLGSYKVYNLSMDNLL
ncbi:prephenate dehydratase [Streptococcaceae bacterium ESL0687]|nr:prephenate dehydratase [Streptococcaceae bacterium ESL0687]